MQYWRYIILIVLVIVLAPTITLMNQVEALKKQGKTQQAQQKQKLLTWCTRGLIAIFIAVLAITMYNIYA